MSKNYEVVYAILENPKIIPVWISDGRITEQDVMTALNYISEQNLLTHKKFIERTEDIQRYSNVYQRIPILVQAGINDDEIKEYIAKWIDKRD